MIHVVHVTPEVRQACWNVKIHKVLTYTAVNQIYQTNGKWQYDKEYTPATRMCCKRGINSQSKQHRVSPVRNRWPLLPRCSSILIS